MKLANVFAAHAAVTRLATLKMTPKVAYDVLKFSRQFDAEHLIVEKQRVALVREKSGAGEGGPASVEPGTPEFEAFVAAFNEVLAVESELALCPMTIYALIAALDAAEGNTLSVQDIALLEPLFESDEEPEAEPEVD